MTISDEKLLPCPFCGNSDRPMVTPYTGEPYFPGFVVQCNAYGWDGDPSKGCGAATGWCETEADAIAAWNRRACLPNPAYHDTQTSLTAAGEGEGVEVVAHAYVVDGECEQIEWGSEIDLPDDPALVALVRLSDFQARERALKDEIERLTRERDALDDECQQSMLDIARDRDRAETAEAKLDEAKAVLEPFAATADHDIGLGEADSDTFLPMTNYNSAAKITVGNMRAALTFLSTLTEHVDGDVSKSAEKSNTSDATYTAEDGLRRAREIAVQSEAAPLCMGEIVKVVDMALGERTALPEWMLKDPAPVITADMVDRACRAYALARYEGAAVWPDDFPSVAVESSRRDMRAALEAAGEPHDR